MGISIQQWRSAIGCHSGNSSNYFKTGTSSSSSSSTRVRTRSFVFILTLLSFFLILTAAFYTDKLFPTLENPATYSIFSACRSTAVQTPSILNLLPPWPPSTSSFIWQVPWFSASPATWAAVWSPTPSPPWSAASQPAPTPPWQVTWLSPSTPPQQAPWQPAYPSAWSATSSPSWPSASLTASASAPILPWQVTWSASSSSQQSPWSTAHPSTWSPTPSPPWPAAYPLASQPVCSPWSPACPAWSAPSWLSNKDRNQLVRAKNGNRQNRGIKLAHWNAGSAHLVNKMHEIEQVVSDNHPHLLGISEANLKRDHDIDDVQLQEYDLILSKTIDNDNLQVSRVVCYKHQSLVGNVREDLMSDQFSSIWLEIGLPGKRKFLVCQLYREWRYLGQPDRGIHSNSIQEQLRRWVIFLDQWEQALATGKEVIVLGDCNLDHLKFDSAGVLQPLVDSMVQRIYPHGVCTMCPNSHS